MTATTTARTAAATNNNGYTQNLKNQVNERVSNVSVTHATTRTIVEMCTAGRTEGVQTGIKELCFIVIIVIIIAQSN